MTLDEAWETEVSAEEARHEVRKHGQSWQAFVREVGERDTYLGREVLEWLGY